LSRLWAFLAVALPVLGALIAALPATDLTYQLRAGAEILETGRIPDVDTWTFTARGSEWFDQQWGAQVLLELTYRIGGWTGLVLLRAALVGTIVGALLLLCRHRGMNVRTAAWLTLAAFVVAAPAMALRPQLIAMALFGLTLLIVTDRAEHPRTLWLVPVITVIWANTHGSFFLPPLVLVLTWLADASWRDRARPYRSLYIGFVSALAACLTPFGPAVWNYVIALSRNPEVTGLISEWQPTTLRDVPGVLFFGSALLVVGYLARRSRPTPWPALLWFACFFGIGLVAARGIAWWPLAAVAALAPLLEPGDERQEERHPPPALALANAVVAGALVLAGIVLVPIWRPLDPHLGSPSGVLTQAPSEITGYLREHASSDARVLNPQRWGSWFEFALRDVPVAIDSRIELFPSEVWDDYVAVRSGLHGWEAVLERWDVAIIVAAPEDAEMVDRLLAAGWQTAWSGAEGDVLLRR
jgi:hypothetical protein